MDVVRRDEHVLPITVPQALDSLSRSIEDIAKKNRTLIEYYIHPRPVPTEIEDYRPKLEVLYARVRTLATLDLRNLRLLLDDASIRVVDCLLPIIEQLLKAADSIQDLFIDRYDRSLEMRLPYDTIMETLAYRMKQIRKMIHDHMRSTRRQSAMHLVPFPPSFIESSFCRYAIAFNNERDYGQLSQVLSQDLTFEQKEKLRNLKGAYVSWDCPGCSFKLKFHISTSNRSNIHTTDDVRFHPNVPEVEYRPAWLVKCHLYQRSTKNRRDTVNHGRERESGIFGARQPSVNRRSTDLSGPRKSGMFFFNAPRRSKSIPLKTTSSDPTRGPPAKYGCPFCFAKGEEYGHMDYRTGKELAEHIAQRHGFKRLLPSLLVEEYLVAMNGRCPDNVRRWDLNIRSRYS